MANNKSYFTKVIFLNKYTKGKSREQIQERLENIKLPPLFIDDLIVINNS